MQREGGKAGGRATGAGPGPGAERLAVLQRGYKGAPLVIIRRWLRADEALLRRFLAELDPTDRQRFEACKAAEWVLLDFAAHVFALTAPLLYPGTALPLRLLGRNLCNDNLHGWLRFVLRTLTVPFLVAQTARVWHSYHVLGVANLEVIGDRLLDLRVRDYPELPSAIRETIAGYLSELIERTGAREVHVRTTDDGPNCWVWRVSWRG